MRTTLEIDDSVLAAARALAADEHTSLGHAVSTLARRGLAARAAAPVAPTGHGLPVFPVDVATPPLTLELVNEHRDAP